MDSATNPYRPGAGRRPPVLAGRTALLESFDVVQRRAETSGEGDRSWVLHGLRGVGKTVLLNELMDRVTAAGWIVAKVEAGQGGALGPALSRGLVRSMRAATGRHPTARLGRLLSVFTAFSLRVDPTGAVALGVDVDPARGVADSGRLAVDVAALFEVLGETARDLGIGVLLLVDELQEAGAEGLEALNVAVHEVGQASSPLPVVVVGAGLPSLPATLAEATSYAERLYEYRSVGLLDDAGARDALVGPAAGLGVGWTPDALALALDAARGYPYFLQAVGRHVWDAARRDVIEVEDVEVGRRAATEEVDQGLYRSRWERATPAQQELLRALARLGGDGAAPVLDLARETGRRRSSDISVARRALIAKGLVYPPERGSLAFTVPGMGDFVTRQA